MFIGSGLDAISNFASLMPENLREDEAIQLINYYGKQLVDENTTMITPPHETIKTQPAKKEVRSRVQSNHSSGTPAPPIIRPKPFQKQQGQATINQDPVQVKRNYNAQKLKLMQTVQVVQRRLPRQSHPDPYPLADTIKPKKPKKDKLGDSPNSRNKNYSIYTKKFQTGYQRNNISQNRRLLQRFEFISRELEREGVAFQAQDNPETTQINQSEKQKTVNEFIRRMEEDRHRRIETQTRQSIEKIMSKQALMAKQMTPPKQEKERYRSVTPVKDSMSVKERARYKEIKRKRQLEDLFQKTSFTPNQDLPRPKTNKFGLGYLKQQAQQQQHDSRVVHLRSPQQIQFLLNDPSK